MQANFAQETAFQFLEKRLVGNFNTLLKFEAIIAIVCYSAEPDHKKFLIKNPSYKVQRFTLSAKP